jgi:RND family efflux transporter MFP subunit
MKLATFLRSTHFVNFLSGEILEMLSEHPLLSRRQKGSPGGTLFTLVALLCSPLSAAQAVQQSFDCMIEPSVLIEVGSPIEGVIDTVAVDRGDKVFVGQVVATLVAGAEEVAVEMAEFRATSEARVDAAKARQQFAQHKYTRATELSKNKHMSENDLEEAVTESLLADLALQEAIEDSELAKLELRQARELLALRSVRSPIDGVVVERFHTVGDLMEDGPIMKLAQLDPLYVEVVLPIGMLEKVQAGMWADVEPGEFHIGTLKAEVTLIDQVVDAASGTLGVRLALANNELEIPPGLECTVTFPDIE